MISLKATSRFIIASGLAALIFSCNNDSEKTAASQSTADTSATETAAPVTPAAAMPFDVMEISHTVQDYAKWRPAFDLDSVTRKAGGMELIVVGKNINNPNDILIVLKAADMQKAKEFAADPRLKDVMEKAGVISKPDIQRFHVIRFNPDANEKQWVTVTHQVKDFDVWLKTFDEEGAVARAKQGLFDVALARGVDDPNLVHLVFDVTQANMEKAKAAINSEDKKQLMKKAGVEGAPKIIYYKSAE